MFDWKYYFDFDVDNNDDDDEIVICFDCSPALDRKKPFSHGTPDTAAVMPHRRESNSSAFELEHRNIDHNHQAANLPRTYFQNNLGEISDQKCNNSKLKC